MQPIANTPNLLYWLFIAIAIFISTSTLGKLWKRRENHRWTIGYAIVFLSGFVMVYLGFWDLNTWAGLFFAVGISGVIKVGYHQYQSSKEAESLRRK